MSAVTQPSGTVTLVFTDIEGSTRLLERLGVERYRAALVDHRVVVRRACERHGGYEVHYEGDAFFFSFAQPTAALDAMREAIAELDGSLVAVRVGIHTGAPALDPPKYVGLDVHRAARIMDAAHGGQIVLTSETVAAIPLGHDYELTDLGEHRFKDIRQPERVYQLGTGKHPPLRSLYRRTLPVPGTPFLGRTAEVEAVTALLSDPDTRLLTLTGPGGTGKTRLALRAAEGTSLHYPDGTTWIDLAPLGDADLVLPAIAQTVDVREEPGKPLASTLSEALLGKRALLVLDNAEHLLPDVADLIAELILSCPTVAFLVTSRERLELRAETIWPVPTMTRSDGETLFLHRARAAGTALVADDTVRELCDRVDGLPLAIELAAAQTMSTPVAEILEGIGERLLSLAARARDVDERQRTIEATIAWSYDLLTPEQQRALRALGVFAGGWPDESATEAVGASAHVLEALVCKSLVQRRTIESGTERYSMLDTIRAYALERLEDSGEQNEVRDRHAAWFAELARALEPDTYTSATTADHAAFTTDLPNFRLALDRAVQNDDGRTATSIVRSLASYLYVRVPTLEGRRIARSTLPLSGADEIDRGHVLYYDACISMDMGLADETRAALSEAESLFSAAGDPGGLSLVENLRCFHDATVGEYAAAALAGERAAAYAREAGADGLVDIAHEHLAYALLGLATQGPRRDEAALRRSLELSREAVRRAEASGSPYALSSTYCNLVPPLIELGMLDEAAMTVGRALELDEQHGFALPYSAMEAASLAGMLGEHETAIRIVVPCLDDLASKSVSLQAYGMREVEAIYAGARAALGEDVVLGVERAAKETTLEQAREFATTFIARRLSTQSANGDPRAESLDAAR